MSVGSMPKGGMGDSLEFLVGGEGGCSSVLHHQTLFEIKICNFPDLLHTSHFSCATEKIKRIKKERLFTCSLDLVVLEYWGGV